MLNQTRVPNWLFGGVVIWLVYAITLSILHLRLLSVWGVSFSLQLYKLSDFEPVSLTHILLLGMVAPGFFFLEVLAFLRIHIPCLDAAIFNWRTMVFISSLPAFVIGAMITAQDRRITLMGTIMGLTMLGGCLLFVLNHLLSI